MNFFSMVEGRVSVDSRILDVRADDADVLVCVGLESRAMVMAGADWRDLVDGDGERLNLWR